MTEENISVDELAGLAYVTAAEPTNHDLKSVAELGSKQMALEDEIEDLEAKLSEKKKELERLSIVTLPEAMLQVGLRDGVTLSNGAKVTIKEDVRCGVTEAKKPEAFAWLEKNNLGDIIKTQLVIPFAAGEAENVAAMERHISTSNVSHGSTTSKRFIEPQTLKATVKERLKKELEANMKQIPLPPEAVLPKEVFAAQLINVAKISRPKK